MVVCAILCSHSTARPLAFVHVAVIDCTGTAEQRGMTVVIVGDRVVAAGRLFPIARMQRDLMKSAKVRQ